jgi:hypothetical protein
MQMIIPLIVCLFFAVQEAHHPDPGIEVGEDRLLSVDGPAAE